MSQVGYSCGFSCNIFDPLTNLYPTGMLSNILRRNLVSDLGETTTKFGMFVANSFVNPMQVKLIMCVAYIWKVSTPQANHKKDSAQD